MRVARTLSRANNGPRFTTPKNGKGRSITLTKQAVETLRSHRKRQNKERLRLGTVLSGKIMASYLLLRPAHP
jgi:integrase